MISTVTTYVSRLCRMKVSTLIPVFFALLVAVSCSNEETTPGGQDEKILVDATLVFSTSAAQVKALTQLAGLNIDVNEFKHAVDVYKVSYKTEYKAGTVTASGLIAFPKTSDELPMISFQHGTITRDADAPSNSTLSNPESLLYACALSSSGFIATLPDYLGFGASSTLIHPYFVESLTASAVVDLLYAASELAETKNIKFNSRLFLAGYSEGGYATMATHKAIEETKPEGFDLIASFPGAGAYDLSAMQEHLLGLQTYDDPYYLAYIALAYQEAYDLPQLLTDFFQEPYASRIPSLFDHQKSPGEINAQLTTTIPDLVTADLSAHIATDPAYAYLKDAFMSNTLTEWAPQKPMFMYHGQSDTTVPFENSVSTYNALLANGASEETVKLIPLPGTHSSAVAPYITDFIARLWTLK
jgi:pimeloyl-ACP methyl ester carboxylesterase